MTAETLTKYFDRISEAPDAVPRLRRFILDLAVRGKLVEQDLFDEPAAELLALNDRARRECAKVDRRSDVEKQALLVPEERWKVPTCWEWRGLADLVLFIDYRGKTPNKVMQGVRLITAKNVKKGHINLSPEEFLTEPDYDKWMIRGLPRVGDILFTTEAPMGNTAVVCLPERFALAQRVICFRSYGALSSDFLALQLLAEPFQDLLDKTATGLTAKGIKAAKLKRLPVAVPPLAEQHRIVAKVDELMTLCDQLEAARTEREARRDRLVTASLHRIGTDTAMPVDARFHLDHLTQLTTRPDHIKQLRQTIRNLAVRGRLVPQDPTDEPAAELLKRIQLEKARLVKLGDIRAGKRPIPAQAKDLMFRLMPGWQPAKIGQILVELKTGPFGSALHQSDYQKGGIPVINPASIKNERLIPIDGMAVGTATLERLSNFKLREGDIVMARRGEMGRCAVVTEKEAGWLCGTGSLVLRLPKCVSPLFLALLIGAPFVREYLGGSSVGSTMQNLNQSILLNLVVGLPPLAEQHRIVAKVNELMVLCDQLEAQLGTTETDSRCLLEAVLRDALTPPL